MARAKPPSKAKKDPLDRELAQIANAWAHPATSVTLDPALAEARVRTGWAARAPVFEASLPLASEQGRALFGQAKAYVDAGMPRGARQPDEQAAFFAVAGSANVPGAPCWADFYGRWVEEGGLDHAIATVLRIPATRDDVLRNEAVLLPGTTGAYLHGVLVALAPKVQALEPAARAELSAKVAPLAHTSTPEAAAALALLLDDEEIARDAIARADAEALSYRHPWPTELFSVLRSGEVFAHLLSRGAEAFQFFAAGYVLRARGRVPDAGLADALVRFFAAAMAEPRRMNAAYARKFAAVACTIPDPRLAWLLTEHGGHPFLERHAPVYLARHPEVRPERPSESALAARMVPEPAPPRPAGFTKRELDALDPEAREQRLLGQLEHGHVGTAFALTLLAEYPTPRLAVAIAEKMAEPDFGTQAPKPGFVKALKKDLATLATEHPALGQSLAAAKKAKKKG
ncbi:MAG: hypothetical protein IPJ34_07845 [Myxococcales bacterium]|nr:hypothetical protein [Myxococcales bacterium]